MAEYVEPFPPATRGDEFGNLAPYRQGRPHRGQDWSVKLGSTIPAITNGQVITNTWSDVLGWTLIQTTDDGLFVLYAHLANQPNLKLGHKLKLGDPVGKVAATGTAATGPHLHLSISKSKNVALCVYEKLIDPLKHILANPVKKPATKPATKPAAKGKK